MASGRGFVYKTQKRDWFPPLLMPGFPIKSPFMLISFSLSMSCSASVGPYCERGQGGDVNTRRGMC